MANCNIMPKGALYNSIWRAKQDIMYKILRDGHTSYSKLEPENKYYFYGARNRLVEEGLVCGDDNWLMIRAEKMIEAILKYG
jgi:hypothetical protein